MGAICKVCNEQESKYKCPKCFSPYCTLICFKKHKETPCEVLDATKEVTIKRKEIKTLNPYDEEEDPSRLNHKDLEKLIYSKEIQDYLKHPKIREIIKEIDRSQTPEKDLDYVRGTDEVFDQFTNKLVEITFKDKLEAFNAKK